MIFLDKNSKKKIYQVLHNITGLGHSNTTLICKKFGFQKNCVLSLKRFCIALSPGPAECAERLNKANCLLETTKTRLADSWESEHTDGSKSRSKQLL